MKQLRRFLRDVTAKDRITWSRHVTSATRRNSIRSPFPLQILSEAFTTSAVAACWFGYRGVAKFFNPLHHYSRPFVVAATDNEKISHTETVLLNIWTFCCVDAEYGLNIKQSVFAVSKDDMFSSDLESAQKAERHRCLQPVHAVRHRKYFSQNCGSGWHQTNFEGFRKQ